MPWVVGRGIEAAAIVLNADPTVIRCYVTIDSDLVGFGVLGGIAHRLDQDRPNFCSDCAVGLRPLVDRNDDRGRASTEFGGDAVVKGRSLQDKD